MEILRKKMRHAVADATTKVRAQIPREEVMYTSIVSRTWRIHEESNYSLLGLKHGAVY